MASKINPYLFEGDIAVSNGQPGPSLNPAEKVFLIAGYIQENYHQSLSLKEISLLFSIRPDVLSRLFKKEIGIGLAFFICTMRVEKAKRLLHDRTRRIKDIGYFVGFSNPQVFCKAFKKVTKLSPRSYQKYISQYISK